jgi:Ca2+/Na+ antiporter
LKEYKNDKPKGIEAKCKALFMKIKIWQMLLVFIGCSIVIIAASFCIALSTDWILSSWGWDSDSPQTGFGYSLLLGIVTSIPETITVISLLKLKNINAAFGDILGSNMFTCLILSIVDLVYWHGNDTLFGKGSSEALSISFWCFVSMIFVGLFLLVNWLYRNSRHGQLYYGIQISLLVAISLSYIAYLILSGMGIQIFSPINPDPGPPAVTSGWSDMCNILDFSKVYLMR